MIPNNVKNIGESAFECCKNLENIILSNKLTSIGEYAFSYCTNMKEINIPDSVNIIGNYAFSYCESLKSITIPENVTSIGIYAFYNCNNLAKVYYNAIEASYDGIKYDSANNGLFRYALFENCNNITSIILGNKVKKIGNGIFGNLPNITEITLPESLKSIGMFAFYDDSNLQTIYYNAIDCSSDGIFMNINNVKACLFPYQNSGVTNIIIGDKVETLDRYIFGRCKIENITIPANVKKIRDNAFYNCTNLKEILIQNPEDSISGAPWSNVSGITVKWNQ
jgi:hypothetical protein